MKKSVLIAVIFALAVGSVFAERLYLIQGTYLSTQRTYEDSLGNEATDTYGQFGINFTTFQGQGLGFYSTATFLIPVEYKYEENGYEYPYDIDDLSYTYDSLMLGLDMLLGVGFLAPITPGFAIVAAGGLHFNGIILMSSSYLVDNYLAYNLGPGASVNALLKLTPNLNVNVGGQIAWDMLEFVHLPELSSSVSAKGGITWGVSAGIGFSY